MLPYSLVIMDTITKQIIRANQIMYTMNDVKHELKNLRLQNPIIIFKGFEPNIILENVGKTDVKELMILVENKKFNQPWVRAFSNYKPMTLTGGEKVVLPLMLNFGLSEQLPNQVFYRIKMNYEDINGNAYEKYSDIFWDTKNNTWNMGGPNDDLNPTYHAPQ